MRPEFGAFATAEPRPSSSARGRSAKRRHAHLRPRRGAFLASFDAHDSRGAVPTCASRPAVESSTSARSRAGLGAVHGLVRGDQARHRGILRVAGPRSARARSPSPAGRARLHQDLLRRHAVPVDEPLGLYARRREAIDGLDRRFGQGRRRTIGRGPSHHCRSPRHTAQAAIPAGTLARRVSKLRRYAPSAMFDKQIRKTNQLAGQLGRLRLLDAAAEPPGTPLIAPDGARACCRSPSGDVAPADECASARTRSGGVVERSADSESPAILQPPAGA